MTHRLVLSQVLALAASLATVLPSAARSEPTREGSPAAADESASSPPTLEKRLAELEKNFARSDAERKQLADDLARLKEQTELERQGSEIRAADEKEHSLKLFGFTDVNAIRGVYSASSPYAALNNLSFLVWHLNLFLDRQLSDSFRAQAEVRFTFYPLGQETSFETLQTAYARTDTTVTDAFFDTVRWGGIVVERAWIEYHPVDWIALRVGRILTPYSIWNEEHGTPVLIPVEQPLMIQDQVIPRAQSGLWLHGRVFPISGLVVDYGLTLSNGRGPMDEVWDLDNNKAVGGRLRFAWDGPLKLTVGGYYYAGTYTDVKKKLLALDPMLVQTMATVRYVEHTLAGEFLLEWQGLRLQAEGVFGSVVYDNGLRELDPLTRKMLPDHYRNSGYVLVAYRLPLRFAELRPYVMYDRFEREPKSRGQVLAGGVNWRIIPSVVAKFEYVRAFTTYSSDVMQVLALQLAAAF